MRFEFGPDPTLDRRGREGTPHGSGGGFERECVQLAGQDGRSGPRLEQPHDLVRVARGLAPLDLGSAPEQVEDAHQTTTAPRFTHGRRRSCAPEFRQAFAVATVPVVGASYR